MRHGEAGFAERDFDRSLTENGIEQCKAQGLRLKENKVACSAIVSSPAARAWSSAATVAGVIDYPVDKIIPVDTLYNAREETILHIIKNFDDSWHTVLLIGHNPGLSFLAHTLCSKIQGSLDVSEYYELSFPLLHWSDIAAAKG